MAQPHNTTRILRRLLTGGVYARADRLLERIHAADLGPILAELTHDEIRTVIDLLHRQGRAATTLKELPSELQSSVFDAVTDERLAAILAGLEIDDMLELIEHIPEDRREPIRGMLPDESQSALRKAELYPPSSAGRAMTTSYVALDEKMTAQEAIDSIRSAGELAESVLYLYVVDELQQLRGVVPIRRLVTSPPDRPCADLMIREPVSTSPCGECNH